MPGDQSVLYVEDEPLLRELAEIILSNAGFRVVTAENGESAFEALDDEGQPFCAVVTDVNLGRGPDGWAVARHAREIDKSLPVVYVTGASGHQWNSEGVPESLLLRKPFTSRQILDALRSLLGADAGRCSVV